MSNIPSELKYVSSHEWLRLEADGTVTVGITEHAQELLGDIVFVELPEVGANLAADEQAGVVESVKAASDVYAPIAGEIVAMIIYRNCRFVWWVMKNGWNIKRARNFSKRLDYGSILPLGIAMSRLPLP